MDDRLPTELPNFPVAESLPVLQGKIKPIPGLEQLGLEAGASPKLVAAIQLRAYGRKPYQKRGGSAGR